MYNPLNFIDTPSFIKMANAKQETVGELLFKDNGELEFIGNVQESAQVFFDHVIKVNSDYIKNLENK